MLCNGLIALKDSINIFFLVCMRYKYKLVFFAYVCGKLIVKKKYNAIRTFLMEQYNVSIMHTPLDI